MLGGRILWGRIIFFGTTLFLVFLLGLLIGNNFNGGISQEMHEQKLDEVQNDMDQEVTRLQGELKLATEKLAELSAPQDQQAAAGEGDASGQASGESTGPTTEQTYETKKGDTLWGIAEKFYGDGSQWTVIADANGLNKDSPITAGMQLKIPAKAASEESQADSSGGTASSGGQASP